MNGVKHNISHCLIETHIVVFSNSLSRVLNVLWMQGEKYRSNKGGCACEVLASTILLYSL